MHNKTTKSIKLSKKILFSAILSLAVSQGFAQLPNNPGKIEIQLARCIDKSMATSVHIIEYDTLTKSIKEGLRESDGFSGVVVSAAGHILTVSHAAVPDEVYQVRFPDGKRYIAKGLGRIGIQSEGTDHDMAMLKISEPGKWPYAEMGNTKTLHIGDPLISISYPSSFDKLHPNVRVGKLTDLDTSDGFITSTVKMEPGDSGGPLFDIYGRVVGIHSFINAGEDENFDVPIEFYLKYWTALNIAEDYTAIPAPDIIAPVKKEKLSKLLTMNGTDDVNTIVKNSSIAISSKVGTKQVHILGTLVTQGNQTFIFSKSTMVGNTPQALVNGKKVKLQVLHRDRENDLILMQSAEEIGKGITIDKTPTFIPLRQDLGKFLISDLGTERKKSGVLSAFNVDLPADFSSAFIGAGAIYQNGKITFSEIMELDSSKTLLRKGDQVVKINNVPIKEAADYDHEFGKYLAGDSISLDLIRQGKPIQVSLLLLGQPTFRHVSFDYPGGRSVRSDGFKQVLVQDAAIKPDECGGPVFDRLGRFCGINIARHSRTSTIIIPASVLSTYIKNYTSTL